MAKVLLVIASTLEAVTGVGLIIAPTMVRSLLGTDISGAALAIARMAGFGLLLLGVACWPRVEANLLRLLAMFIYNVLATFTLDTYALAVNRSENFCYRRLQSTPRWQLSLSESGSNI